LNAIEKTLVELQNTSLSVLPIIEIAVKVITLENLQEHDSFALARGHPEKGKVFCLSIYNSNY